MARSFNGSRHGNRKPVPAALGTKTKLRGGGGEGKGGEGKASQEGAKIESVDLTGGSYAEATPFTAFPRMALGRQKNKTPACPGEARADAMGAFTWFILTGE